MLLTLVRVAVLCVVENLAKYAMSVPFKPLITGIYPEKNDKC